jgi:hypothetical protein
VIRISDASLPSGGVWTVTLTPEGGRTKIGIVEDGDVYNP